MKIKNIIKIISLMILLLPAFVKAESIDLSKYKTRNLINVIKEEKIEADLANYKEDENQAIVYLFRGRGCSHCYDFLEYAATDLVTNYGEKFKLISFEIWNDVTNAGLMKKVSTFRGDNATGVPYIIIGDKSFKGYSSDSNSEIEAAINKLYKTELAKRYDVFKEINNSEKKKNPNDALYLLIPALLLLIVYVIIRGANKEN